MANLTVRAALDSKKNALTYGNRLILPFHCNFVEIRIGTKLSTLSSQDTYTDFSSLNHQVTLDEQETYTSVYFIDYKNLMSEFGRHQGDVVITYCEKDKDIFDTGAHQKVILQFRDDTNEVQMVRDSA